MCVSAGRHLAGEIGQEFAQRQQDEKKTDDLYVALCVCGPCSLSLMVALALRRMKLVEEIVPFNVEHNAEVEAVDLLMEVRVPACGV